jgi:cytoskeletal protein CcmA (bactofilin family)
MFGRRNPGHSPAPTAPSPATSDSDIDLDLLPDLPTIPPPTQGEPSPEPPPSDPAWHAGAQPPPAPPLVRTRFSEPIPGPGASSAATSTEMASWPTGVMMEDAATMVFQTPAAPPPAAAVPAAAAPAADKPVARPRPISESVIGPDDFFDGHYRSERGVRIQGNARGSIESHQYIFVEDGADVEADLSAEDITVAGSFKGKIECRRRLEITGKGRVHGQVQTVLLVVHEGGVIDGELHMREADDKSAPS